MKNMMTDIQFEVGKYYWIEYTYNNNKYNEFACYKNFDFGKHYFKCDNGEWLILKPEQILAVKNDINKNPRCNGDSITK